MRSDATPAFGEDYSASAEKIGVPNCSASEEAPAVYGEQAEAHAICT